jgi:GDP-D-mannose dehydratase
MRKALITGITGQEIACFTAFLLEIGSTEIYKENFL